MWEHCKLDSEASIYFEQAMAQLYFSAQAHDRILKVARTLAVVAAGPFVLARVRVVCRIRAPRRGSIP